MPRTNPPAARLAATLALLAVTLATGADPPTELDPARAAIARAEALRGEWSGLVRNESIDARWVDDAVLEFAVTDESGVAATRRLDARAAVAQAVAAPRLPGWLRLARVSRSRAGGSECIVQVHNRLDRAVDLVWLDHAGRRKHFGTIAPGRLRVQPTYGGHAWIVVDRAEALAGRDAVLVAFEAPASGGQVLVDPGAIAEFAGIPTGEPRRATPLDELEPPPSPRSPDGRREAFLREGDVWIRSLAGGTDLRLSEDASQTVRYVDSFWWSPDGRHVATLRTEVAPVREIPIVETSPPGEVQPRLEMLRYPKPGDPIDRVEPVIFETSTGRRVTFEDALFPDPLSIDRLAWSSTRGVLSFLYVRRGHQEARLIEVDPSSGTARAAIEERSPTFLDTVHKTFLKRLPGDRAIWMSERTGWNQLHLVDLASGAITPITHGPSAGVSEREQLGTWVVRGVERIDAVDDGSSDGSIAIVFGAMGMREGEDPYHLHLGRVVLAPDGTASPVTWLTEGDGTHEFEFSPDGAFVSVRHSRVDRAPIHELRRVEDGSLVATLAVADDSRLRAAGWRPPERFVAMGRDGTTPIHGVIFLPRDFDPTLAHPVIEQIYAGPQDFHVPKSFAAWHGARELAELGAAVVQVDGMGTNWRSKSFHDVCARDLADAGLPDRVAWIRAAAADRPWMDLARVGIHGGSAGGQNAMRALLDHGDFYSVAVADCGCHDNRLDKRWWNEAWMGFPIGPHYEAQSNATDAHRLQGRLLLIVGGEDRNVDPASTMRVVDALVAADKDFDLLVIPSAGHGAAESPYGRRRRAAFLHEHLGGPRPIEAEAGTEGSAPGASLE